MRFDGWTALSVLLLLVGVAIWLYMAATFGNGSDVGVYAIGMTLIAFGVAGLLASSAGPAPTAA